MITIRIKYENGNIENLDIPKPSFKLRDASEDCMDDYISDYIQEKKIKYKWFRIIKL